MTEDTSRDGQETQPKPPWVTEQVRIPAGTRQFPGGRPERLPRVPVPGRNADDKLWEHACIYGGIAVLGAWIAAVAIPRDWPLWQVSTLAALVTAVTWYRALTLTAAPALAGYLGAWGIALTGWLTAARLAGPFRGTLVFALAAIAIVLIPTGVHVIRGYRHVTQHAAEGGHQDEDARRCLFWQNLLARLGVRNFRVRFVSRTDTGWMVHCQFSKAAEGRPVSPQLDTDLARRICIQRRLPAGAVYVETEPEGGTAADFIVHVNESRGPRMTRFLPAENVLLSITRDFALGVHDTGREYLLRLREVVVFICGVIGSGKSTLLNVFLAQLCRMPDALICMIDLKGGQEARAWLMPWIMGLTDKPAIHWLATNREEADIMLDALKRGGTARAESGRYKRKLIPGLQRDGTMAPAFIVLCDETARLTGHFTKEDGLLSTKLAVKLLEVAETFRSVAISPVISAVRAVVDTTGNSGIKAMSEVTLGMKVRTVDEGRAIFGDDYAAAQALARLKDKGMFIPKVGSVLAAPVHGYNITDGTPDEDTGQPTYDMITPIVLGTADRCPDPEDFVIEAMGEAYAQRWTQPHIAGLIETWKAQAHEEGWAAADAPPRPAEVPASEDEAWDDIVSRLGPLGDDLDGGYGSSPGRGKLHPSRKRMYELLIARGPVGYTVDQLRNLLENEGKGVTRQTVHDWLKADVPAGRVRKHGKARSPRAGYSWALTPGEEFGIPGWD